MEIGLLPTAPPPPQGQHWLSSFLQAEYYEDCTIHMHLINNKNSRCNFFCINCTIPICDYCNNSPRHEGHHILQIRRASKACSVDAASIERLIDTSGLHKFKINGYSIHFLVPRPSSEGSKKKAASVDHDSRCHLCGWTLPGCVAQGSRFCSIYCKLTDKSSPVQRWAGTLDDRPICKTVTAKCRKRPTEGGRGGERDRKRAHKEVRSVKSTAGVEATRADQPEGEHKESSKITGIAMVAGRDASSVGVHRRKGVPHRSPLF